MQKFIYLILVSLLFFNGNPWAKTSVKALKERKAEPVKKKPPVEDDMKGYSLEQITKMLKIAHRNKGKSWVLFPTSYSYCAFGECETQRMGFKKLEKFSVFNRENRTLSRCDDRDCDVYEADYNEEGIVLRIQCKESYGIIIAINLAKLTYTEITTTSLGAMIYYGKVEDLSFYEDAEDD